MASAKNAVAVSWSESDMKERMKPCPFCGFYGTVKFDTDGTKDSMGRKWAYTVSCDRCCASTGVCWNREMAIEAWNRRTNDAEIY